MGIRKHLRLLSLLLVGLAGAGLLTVGFGLTPWSGSIFGSRGDFSLSASSPVTVPQGQTGNIPVTVTSMNHFSGSVSVTTTLTTSASTPPVLKISQLSVSLSSDATASFSVSVSATSSTTQGYYSIIVQATTGTLSHSITVSAQVTPPPPPPTPDFYLYSNVSSLTITQGGSVNATLGVSSVLSYSGNIALTATISPSGANSPSVSLNRTSLFLPAGGINATILTVNTFNATVGSYTISITGVSGSLRHSLDIPLSISHFTGFESLNLEVYSFSSSTSVYLYIRNTGSTTSSLVWYSVTDASGNRYVLAKWNGPVINPNQVGVANIQIGASCSQCVLSGTAFMFTAGNSYTITLITRYSDSFTFTVVR